jgi:hypothetical protein
MNNQSGVIKNRQISRHTLTQSHFQCMCGLRGKQTVILVLLERKIKKFITGGSGQCIKVDKWLKTVNKQKL